MGQEKRLKEVFRVSRILLTARVMVLAARSCREKWKDYSRQRIAVKFDSRNPHGDAAWVSHAATQRYNYHCISLSPGRYACCSYQSVTFRQLNGAIDEQHPPN